MDAKPLLLIGLVISHADEYRCDVFFGPNGWMPRNDIISVDTGRLKSISRSYRKEKK